MHQHTIRIRTPQPALLQQQIMEEQAEALSIVHYEFLRRAGLNPDKPVPDSHKVKIDIVGLTVAETQDALHVAMEIHWPVKHHTTTSQKEG